MPSREKLRIAAILLLCFVVYANSLWGEFVYDDKRQILMNTLIQEPALWTKALSSDVWAFKGGGTVPASNYYRPTFVAWLIGNFWLFGSNPFGWHFTNLLLHAAVTLLAYLLLSRRLGLDKNDAFAIALIFAVHPVHSESVAWISGAPDPLFSLFFLGSVWFAADAGKLHRWSWQLVLSAVLYLLALGAKEIGLLLLPLYYLVSKRLEADLGDRKSKTGVVLMLFGVAAVLFFAVRLAVIERLSHWVEDSVPLSETLLTLPALFLFYLRQIVLPLWLAVNHAIRPVVEPGIEFFILPLLLSSAALAAMWLAARRTKLGIFGLTLFVLTLIPALNLTAFPSEQIAHDRYLYLPLLGFLIVFVPFVHKEIENRFRPSAPITAGLLIVLVTSFSIVTVFNNRVWSNELSLWQHTAKFDPESAFTQAQLGAAYLQRGRTNESITAYDRSLSVRPTPSALLGQGQALAAIGQFERAEANARIIVQTPLEQINAYTLYQGYELLAIALMNSGRAEAAEVSLRKAREALPIYSASLTEKLAVVLYTQGKKQEALAELEVAREKARNDLLPASKTVLLRLGMLYAEVGDRQKAATDLTEFLRLTSNGGYDGVESDRRQAAELLRRLR